MLVDSHCHLNFPDFAGKLPETLNFAKDNHVKLLQTICTRMSEFPDILSIANNNDNVYCSVGVHPNNVGETDLVTTEQLLQASQNDKVIGFGETGLDYYYSKDLLIKQQASFNAHIEASQKTNLPVIVHTRDADDDTALIIKNAMRTKNFPGLIHCFSSSYEFAKSVLDDGFYISISGIITFKKAEDLRQTVKKLPLDRILVETDAPYLAPEPFRGKSNTPAYVYHTAKFLSEFFGVEFKEFCSITTNNFMQLFTKVV